MKGINTSAMMGVLARAMLHESNPGPVNPYDMTGLQEDGGTILRSKHSAARDKRKRSRLQKRLVKAGTIRNYRKAPA